MEKSIYEFTSYKLYIDHKISSMPSKGRGMKLKMAEFLHCQNTYISQILSGPLDFSLEHAAKLNQFFEHTKEEGKFFLLLIHFARAGNDELKRYYEEEMNEIIMRNSDLKKRTNVKNTLKEKDHDIYYSSWYYSAAHILVTIKEFQTVPAIARRLSLSRDKIVEILNFLVGNDLVKKEGNTYSSGQTRIHLAKESPHIQRHHTNWRVKAINSIDLNDPMDLHFSNVVSMGKDDIVKVREIFIKAIAEARSVIKDSPEETLQSICVDFFEA